MRQCGKPQSEEPPESDTGTGGLGLSGLFGGLFQGIDKLITLAAEVAESGGEIKKEGELDLNQLGEGMKGVFGISIRTATGGRPVVERFGNIRQTPEGPKLDPEREPITDVFDEGPEIRVYAEMPGVSKAEIKLDLKGDILDIAASRQSRRYHKEILLPGAVKPESIASSYENGILEVRLQKETCA